MEAVKAVGASVIAYLHHTPLVWYAASLHRVLWYCTPAFVLTVLSPLLLALQGVSFGKLTVSPTLALAVMWTAVVSLRLNTIKQWAFGEDRPYWWVKETTMYAKERAPELLQYPVTCLSSPSAPAYTLLATGVGLVITRAVLDVVRSYNFSSVRRSQLAVAMVWTSYAGLVSSVGLGDFFFSQHFPHQVALAAGIGLCIALMMLESNLGKSTAMWKTLLLNIVLLAATLALMYKKDAVGKFNGHQESAFRWCQRREWLQIDPAPLMDAFVFTGYAVGTSLATAMKYFKKLNKPKFTLAMLASTAILNTIMTQLVLLLPDTIAVFSKHLYVSYVGQMMTAVLVPVLCVALVPYFVQAASGVHSAPASPKAKKQ